ncbi:hypothetical protein ACJIZ3_002057 [Penstemon smallii]|uniref:Non-specific lipid-transfer protein n=1 Tax=Penstemon smallii TaxID=265156 RepID=A0ABD3U5F1_9LAMI
MKGVAVVFVVVLAAVALAATPGNAVSCGDVQGSLAPCLTYLTSGGEPGGACCSGVQSVAGSAQSQQDRQTVCNCLKSASSSFNLQAGNAADLPGKCGVSTGGFTISPNIDCSQMKGVAVIFVAVVAVVALAAMQGNAISCGDVQSSLTPCVPYLTGNSGEPGGGCCSGVQSVSGSVRSQQDRQAVCNCLKSAASSYNLQSGNVASLPGKCGISMGYTFSPNMECSQAKKPRTAAAEDGGDQFERDELLVAVEKLQEVQEEIEKVNEEANKKVLEIEQKYNESRKPVYVRRNKIINSIPGFWATAFLSHPILGDMLTEEDQKIFKYLDSLDVEDFQDLKSGYCITFNFQPNPFFENTKLTKTIKFFDEGTLSATGTAIIWKDGMGPASDVSNNGKKGNKRPLSKESNPKQEEPVEIEEDVTAELIKEDLWPNPIKYLNNGDDEEETREDEEDTEDDEATEDDEGEEDEDEEEGSEEDES